LGALELLEIDASGFDKMDRAILAAIIDKFDGGPVGVDTLATRTCEGCNASGVSSFCRGLLLAHNWVTLS
jgi:Holliday junction resolvasome RuvABC ATP-dependent DNA helicase subunit